jgi:hypothetical protein
MLIGPPSRHGDDAVIDLADRTQALVCPMIGGTSILAVTGVINSEGTIRITGRQRIVPVTATSAS